MLISKKNKKEIYLYLFKEGVLVAKKDTNLPKHDKIDVPNLHVIKLMQSLKTRGYVKENFNWGYYYWFLTNEGVQYLRDYLHLPEEVVPTTLKKPKSVPKPTVSSTTRTSETTSFIEEKKPSGPTPDFKAEFRGGYGRGSRGRDQYRREPNQSGGRDF
jgi:small subunit ribosomal protein S10e